MSMRAPEVRAILERQKLEQSNQTPLYPCQSANLGRYLIAANQLRYKGAQLAPNGRDVEFFFYDPDARGPDLLHRFNAGAVEPVNARMLYEVRSYLLSEVKRVRGATMAKANPTQFLNERLRLSAISPKASHYAGIRAMTVAEARAEGNDLPGYPSDGFLTPYYNAKGKRIEGVWRWRNSRGNPKYKYTQPAGTGCWVYFPRVKGLDWAKVLADPKIPVVIVEGELKALSLCVAGVCAVGIGGVWNWLFHKELLPELRQLAASDREILIAFDSDTEDKQQVAGARYSLAWENLDAGGKPAIVIVPHLNHPDSPAKTGADDLVRITGLRD